MTVEEDAGRLRLRMFAFVALILFGALFTRLWYLQGIDSESFRAEAETNVLREVFQEAPRGRILDRAGRVLVDNQTVDVVTIDKSVLEDLDVDAQEQMFYDLSVAVSRSGRLTKVEAIRREVQSAEYGPFDVIPVAIDVDQKLLVYLGERPTQFPGVEVVSRTVRRYPFGPLASHLLGYVGPVTLEELQAANARIEPEASAPKTYQLSDEIGKTGVERVFEDALRGVPGVRYLEVDNRGEVIGERSEFSRPPVPGADLYLTIDIDLQALTEERLAVGLDSARGGAAAPGEGALNAPAGAAVAVDPRDGALLAMASYPTYDPAEFVNGISTAQFDLLTSPDNFSPILNRAIQGSYAPGSTFKLVTALAALEEGLLGPTSIIDEARGGRIYDTGTYVYSRCQDDFEAADTCEFTSPFEGERTLGLGEALAVSSDVFFYKLGGEGFFQLPAGPDGDEGIQRKAREFGLGNSTGIQLSYERAGAVPDRDYFDALAAEGVFLRDGSQWYAGDTVQLAIGQGDLLVTPTQLANLYATFANGGRLHQINVAQKIVQPDGTVQEFGPRVLRDIDIPTRDYAEVMAGLEGVTRPGGTAGAVFAGFPMNEWSPAGKTGTAQVRTLADTSLFVGYGPTNLEESEIAVAVVLEEAGFGSDAAAPVVRQILEPVATDSVPKARTFGEIAAEQANLLAATDDGSGEEAPEETS